MIPLVMITIGQRVAELLARSGESLSQHDSVVCKHGTVHIRLEVIDSFPVTAREFEAQFQVRDHGCDTSAEVAQFVVKPAIAGHGLHPVWCNYSNERYDIVVEQYY